MFESLFNKVTDLKVCNFIKKRLQHRCALVNILENLRTSFFINYLWRLVLKVNCIPCMTESGDSSANQAKLFMFALAFVRNCRFKVI